MHDFKVKIEKKNRIIRIAVDGVGLTTEVGELNIRELSKMDVFLGEFDVTARFEKFRWSGEKLGYNEKWLCNENKPRTSAYSNATAELNTIKKATSFVLKVQQNISREVTIL